MVCDIFFFVCVCGLTHGRTLRRSRQPTLSPSLAGEGEQGNKASSGLPEEVEEDVVWDRDWLYVVTHPRTYLGSTDRPMAEARFTQEGISKPGFRAEAWFAKKGEP